MQAGDILTEAEAAYIETMQAALMQALDLVTNPEAEAEDADRLEKTIRTILEMNQ